MLSSFFCPDHKIGMDLPQVLHFDLKGPAEINCCQFILLIIEGVRRTVSIIEANKKCEEYSWKPPEEREQKDNRHRGTSPVGNGQRRKDYAQKIPDNSYRSIFSCRFFIVRVAHRGFPILSYHLRVFVQKRDKTTPRR